MATDMDIEMDLDMGITEEELMAQSLDIIPDLEASVSTAPFQAPSYLHTYFKPVRTASTNPLDPK